MHLSEVTAVPCINCGKGNTPDGQTGERPRFVDFERDINWNDPLIICEDCVAKAGGLVGLASKDTLVELNRKLREKDKELHDARVEMQQMKKRARRVGVEFVEPVGS